MMIKTLQRKFVLIAISSLTLVIAALIGTVNLINLYQIDKKAQGLLMILSDNDGKFPEFKKGAPPKHINDMTPETQFETRYFFVKTNAMDEIIQINTGHIAAVSSSDAEDYAQNVLNKKKKEGYNGVYKYRVTEYANGDKLIVFVDCSIRLQSAMSFFISSCSIAVLCIFVVFILVSIFSKRAIRPVMESMEKQKQFITDAGHEIKTPLAIISANTEVIELTAGQSEWTESIKNQVNRLNDLVKNLLTLSKLEEEQETFVFEDFFISETVEDTAHAFLPLANNHGKQMEISVQQGINMNGDEASIRQLVSILIDNAVKYADENGKIIVTFERKGKILLLQVYNDCKNIPDEDLNRLFERFYRTDSSRSRETGGYGIGLSIAKAIVQAHKGKICAKRQQNGICFQVSWELNAERVISCGLRDVKDAEY